jgi:uncharacterized protein (TIGR03790 family)
MIVSRLFLIALLSLFLGSPLAAQQNPDTRPPAGTPKQRTAAELAAQTIVVFNENDLDSTALAGLYVEKRGIPPLNLIPLRCPRSEEITRSEYDSSIAEPLRQALTDRGLWKLHKETGESGRVAETKVRYAVLMYGMPLRVAHMAGYEGDSTEGNPKEIFSRNECAVDSELSVLGLWNRRISGVVANPYFQATKSFEEMEVPSQLLVTRLDGPSPAIVRRMIEDTVAAETKGLRGFVYIDARGITQPPLDMGDGWFHNAGRDARENGQPVILDNGPAPFPDPYPMKHAAVYLGWYAENVVGPFTRSGFRFTPGAIALHLHSFSAVSLRDKSKNWCAPFLASGAAATIGNVYEPYLGLTTQPDIFAQRLREGFTFAEAGYAGQRAVSWMTTFVGDPIYRPYVNVKLDPNNEWDAYRAGVRTWIEKNRAAGEAALANAAKRLDSGIVSESLGLLELFGNDQRAALRAFQEARKTYRDADDRIRVAVHESGAIAAMNGPVEAARFLREQANVNSESANAVLLTGLASIYNPQPKKSAAGTGKPAAEKTAPETPATDKPAPEKSSAPRTSPAKPKEKKR